jgi:hypothetical protein
MACIAYNHFIEVDGDTEVNANLGEEAQQFMNLLKDVSDVPFIGICKFQDPSFKYIYPKKGTLNDAKDSVIDAKTNTPMLMEMAHKLRDEPVLGREPSLQPSVHITPEQRPHIERHKFSASSVAASLPIFAVTQDWYDLMTKHIQSITILDQEVPPPDSVDKRVIQLSRLLALRLLRRLLSQCLVILPTSNKFGS